VTQRGSHADGHPKENFGLRVDPGARRSSCL
jgi:hypothetical protein